MNQANNNKRSEQKQQIRELLAEVQRRLPAGQRQLREAFTSEHNRPVAVKLMDALSDTFYLFDDATAQAFGDAVIELAALRGRGKLTVGYPFAAEVRGQQRRLQHLASKLDEIRVLAAATPPRAPGELVYRNTKGTVLARYRLALKEGDYPALFICRDTRHTRAARRLRNLGFFTFDPETIAGIADDLDRVLHEAAARMATFDELELLHQTTQRIERELASYSQRLERAIRLARRQPDALTPARFERLVNHAVAKMEQLKKLPLQALTSMRKPAE